jgi:nickel-type superoxide dismutase maturation protease
VKFTVALVRGAAALVQRAGLDRVEVVGESMVPTLLPGDRLLVARTSRVRAGDLVVVADPRVGDRDLVKRVVWTGAGVGGRLVVWVEGDNPEASTDSRALGPLPRDLIRERVIWRYGPVARAGKVDGRGRYRARRSGTEAGTGRRPDGGEVTRRRQ